MHRISAFFALLAILMQLFAMPVSAAHMASNMLQASAEKSAGKTISIPVCSSKGTTYLLVKVDDDKPIKPQHMASEHCPFCLVGGGAVLPVAALEVPLWHKSDGPLWPFTPAQLAERDFLWPPGRGPPVA